MIIREWKLSVKLWRRGGLCFHFSFFQPLLALFLHLFAFRMKMAYNKQDSALMIRIYGAERKNGKTFRFAGERGRKGGACGVDHRSFQRPG
ncbi:MAG: hypothetical protein IKP72_18150, partial [Clostridia bacterium]|nr:hypothetical protein [Clostridia bacterium]